jgi:Fe-S-cluster containining protein
MQGDAELIQIVDAALAEAVRKSGHWLACRAGCWDCCVGPFPITQLDAARLRTGLAELATRDPERATRVWTRAVDWASHMEDDEVDELPCPALDPGAGACDLYAARPVTCRVFGPAIQWGAGAVGVCELNFNGATEDEIAACIVPLDLTEREEELEREQERTSGASGQITVAEALLDAR